MKKQVLIKWGIGIFVMAFLASCLPEIDSDFQSSVQEKQLLDEYIIGLESEGENVDTTALGVYYLVLEEGEGEYFPVDGDTVTVSYRGYLMNGKLFDNSEYNFENGEWTFVLGETQTIAGWADGMKVINKGAKVQLMIPSELGYGANGYSTIPPYNTLIFVIDMIDIKQPIN